MNPFRDPLVRRAFGAWQRFPMWAAAAAIAVAAWLAATVTAPLTTDAAADRSFATEAELAADLGPGRNLDARATTAGLFDLNLLDQITGLLDSLDVYEEPVTTVTPLGPYSGSVPPAPYVRSAAGTARAMLYSRDGLIDALDITAGAPDADGVLLPDVVATEVGAAPGDTVELGLEYPTGSGFESPPPATATVAGIYRTEDGLPVVDGGAASWQLPGDPISDEPALLAIVERPAAIALLEATLDRPLITWDMDFGPVVDVERGRDAVRSMAGIQRQFRDPDSIMARRIAAAEAREVNLVSAAETLLERAERAAEELGPVISALTVTARVVSAGTLMLAVSLLCRSRRRELDLATTIGMPAWRVALLVTAEMAISVVAGAAAAYAIVRWAPNLIAGDGHIDSATLDTARSRVIRWFPAGFAAVALSAMVAAWGTDTSTRSRLRALAAALDPLTILTVAAAATGAQLATQSGPALESGSSLLFPTLAILAAAVGVARMTGWVVRRLGRRTTANRPPGRRPALWFASRRLRASIVELATLFVVITAGVGLFVYDTSVSRSAAGGLGDKAAALGAAPTVAELDTTDVLTISDGFPVDLPPATTVVWRSTFVPSGRNAVDVLVVDPATFADAVEWRDSFAGQPLDDLLADIADSSPGGVDVVLAGNYNDNFDDTGTLSFVGAPSLITYRVVARIDAGPWQRLRAPMMLVDQRALAPLLGTDPVFVFDDPEEIPDAETAANLDRLMPTYVWSQLPPAELATAVPSAVFDPELPDVASSEREPGFVAVRLSLPYLELIGAAMLAVSVIAVLVLGSRRRGELAVELAIARQMGVPGRTMLASGMVAAAGVAVLAGALGVAVATVLVHVMTGRLDPAPEFPPGFIGSVAWMDVAIATLTVVAAAVLGAWIDHASARRRPVSEVMRGAE